MILDDCKVCKTSQMEANGPQLFENLHVCKDGHKYTAYYTVKCFNCGLAVDFEYLDELEEYWCIE